MAYFFNKQMSTFDPALGDALGQRIIHEAAAGNLATVLNEITVIRTGEWDRRAFYVDLAAQYLADSERFLDNGCGNLLMGVHAIHCAWQVRGRGQADTVTESSWATFFGLLETAKDALLRAAEQDPADPTPLAFLQTVAMGLQLGKDVALDWFHEATERDPLNRDAHYRHLTLLCEKWGGSHEEMYAFARETVKKVPRNSTLGGILLTAFQEHYLYLLGFADDGKGAKRLTRDAAIRQESIDVYENFLVTHDRTERVADYGIYNVAAWWFLTIEMGDYVRKAIGQIGPYYTEFPWALIYPNPAAGYRAALDFIKVYKE